MRSAARNNQFEGLQKGGYQIKFRWYEWYESISHFLEVHQKKFLIRGFSSLQVWKSWWPSPDEGWVFASVNGEGGRQVNDEDPPSPVCVFFWLELNHKFHHKSTWFPSNKKKWTTSSKAWKFVWKEWMMETLNSIIFSSFVCLLITPPLLVKREDLLQATWSWHKPIIQHQTARKNRFTRFGCSQRAGHRTATGGQVT